MPFIRDYMRLFNQGEADAKVRELYPGERIQPKIQRILNVLSSFEAGFGNLDVVILSVPGRSEIGGNHTDHQGGHVLAASITKDILCIAGVNGTDQIRIFSGSPNPLYVRTGEYRPLAEEKGNALALIRGTVHGFVKYGYKVGGFSAKIVSDIPIGGGLSSSAAFSVCIGKTLSVLFNNDSVSEELLARIAKEAENDFFLKPCGLLDPTACLAGGITILDFFDEKKPKIKHIKQSFYHLGLKAYLLNTGVSHASLTSDYASIPEGMRLIAAHFGKEVLSRVPKEVFFENIPKLYKMGLPELAILRSMHYYQEDERALMEAEAIENNDRNGFLELVRKSGRSSFEVLQNCIPLKSGNRSLSFALAMAEEYVGTKGAVRVHGGGFAGGVQIFVKEDQDKEAMDPIREIYGNDACIPLNVRNFGAYQF